VAGVELGWGLGVSVGVSVAVEVGGYGVTVGGDMVLVGVSVGWKNGKRELRQASNIKRMKIIIKKRRMHIL